MKSMIEIVGLKKSYGEVKAVRDLCFRVRKGELFAFLGVNGAGKSTTINIICGMLEKDSGRVLVNGIDIDDKPEDIKKEIGVVFQNSALDQALTVYDNLQSRAALYGITGESFKKRLAELSKLLELDALLKRTIGKLSGGQKRRIDIARALINKPKLLILDEPTTGLDPQTRKHIWDVLSKLRKNENLTVFLTTHYMEEAAEADYVVMIDAGSVAAEGTPHDLKNTYATDSILLYGVDEEQVKKLGIAYEKQRDLIKIGVKDTEEATRLIVKQPELFSDYEIIKGRMDDVFLNVTGKKLDGDNEK